MRAKELERSVSRAIREDRWDSALANQEELVSLRTRAQGVDHFESAWDALYLKTLLYVKKLPQSDRDEFRRAESLYPQAFRLEDNKDLKEAQVLFEDALEVRRRLLGENNPLTAAAHSKLAQNLMAQRRHEEAHAHLDRARGVYEELFPNGHLDTASAYNNLAVNLYRQGQHANAQPFFEKGLELFRRLAADNHADFVYAYSNVAENLEVLGRHAEAQALNEKALTLAQSILSENHPLTVNAYLQLVLNLTRQGRHAEAEALNHSALRIARRVLPENHGLTASLMNSLAIALKRQGKLDAAQPWFEKSLEMARSVYDKHDPRLVHLYANLAANLNELGRYADAEIYLNDALEIARQVPEKRNLLPGVYNNLAHSLSHQGRYVEAQSLCKQALELNVRDLGENQVETAACYFNLGANLQALGLYLEAQEHFAKASECLDGARRVTAFSGLDRARAESFGARIYHATVLARLGQPDEACQRLEEHLGRGLLDELAARRDIRLTADERETWTRLDTDVARLDALMGRGTGGKQQSERARQIKELEQQRLHASAALGTFQNELVAKYGPLAGESATLAEIQAALADDAALVMWVNLKPYGPNAADPDGDHWAVVVRAQGTPNWIALSGTGREGLWTDDDTSLPSRLRTNLRTRPTPDAPNPSDLVKALRAQRLDPLESALAATPHGLPAAKRLIVLPSSALAGVPIETLIAPGDSRTISYAPSATILTYLRKQPRPVAHLGLLALGDPMFEPEENPTPLPPPPAHGLLVNVVQPGSQGDKLKLQPGDVLLAYNGQALQSRDDLKHLTESPQPIPIEIWREGQVAQRQVDAGPLGVVVDARPAPEAIVANRQFAQLLASTRSGSETFEPLPGTRFEVDALSRLFSQANRPVRTLIAADAAEPALDDIAQAGDLGKYAFIHLATHGLIDEDVPARSAVILTQTGLPDPLEQVLAGKNPYDGRLSVREIQRAWQLNAELVTLSACETALGRQLGGEGFVGFTQALLMSGARSICLSLWKVDDTATALLMQRFYANLLGQREGLAAPLPKAEALAEAKSWLRGLNRAEALTLAADLTGGVARGIAPGRKPDGSLPPVPEVADDAHPYAHPFYWAAFILVGDPD